MIVPLLPAFLMTLSGVPAAALGWIEGVADATASFVKILSGKWADRREGEKAARLRGLRPFLSRAAAHRPRARLADGRPDPVRRPDRQGRPHGAARHDDRRGRAARTPRRRLRPPPRVRQRGRRLRPPPRGGARRVDGPELQDRVPTRGRSRGPFASRAGVRRERGQTRGRHVASLDRPPLRIRRIFFSSSRLLADRWRVRPLRPRRVVGHVSPPQGEGNRNRRGVAARPLGVLERGQVRLLDVGRRAVGPIRAAAAAAGRLVALRRLLRRLRIRIRGVAVGRSRRRVLPLLLAFRRHGEGARHRPRPARSGAGAPSAG